MSARREALVREGASGASIHRIAEKEGVLGNLASGDMYSRKFVLRLEL
jgi:hypothetical protein